MFLEEDDSRSASRSSCASTIIASLLVPSTSPAEVEINLELDTTDPKEFKESVGGIGFNRAERELIEGLAFMRNPGLTYVRMWLVPFGSDEKALNPCFGVALRANLAK